MEVNKNSFIGITVRVIAVLIMLANVICYPPIASKYINQLISGEIILNEKTEIIIAILFYLIIVLLIFF